MTAAPGPNDLDQYGTSAFQRSNLVFSDGVYAIFRNGSRLIDGSGADLLATVTVATDTGTSYTYALTDAGTYKRHSNASAITATVPPNSSVAFPIGSQITVEQSGAGLLTIAAGAGVTIRTTTTLKMNAQYAVATLIKVAADEWNLTGNLSAT
jgi:hypothetical protein